VVQTTPHGSGRGLAGRRDPPRPAEKAYGLEGCGNCRSHAPGQSRAVYRIWQAHGLKPRRVESLNLSTDSDFGAKLRDVMGLYLGPSLQSAGFACGREEPDSGAGSYSTDSAAAT
jgi:hypothetical protein